MAIKIQLKDSNSIKLLTKGTYLEEDLYIYIEDEVIESEEKQFIEKTITRISNNATKIKDYAFQTCYSLTSISFPACTSIGISAFGGCTSLTEASFPQCTSIGSYAFGGCRSLTEANFPKCTSIVISAFRNCTSLTSISFPQCSYIGSYAFWHCSSLESVYLNVSSVPTLDNANAFANTPLSNSSYLGRFGSIYVPSSLYESFINGTNWATYSSRIVSYF